MFLQCEIIDGVAVPRDWTEDENAAKTHDFITGDISVDKADLSPNLGCGCHAAGSPSDNNHFCHAFSPGFLFGLDTFLYTRFFNSFLIRFTFYRISSTIFFIELGNQTF